ncbi:hypothetical protein RirG_013300 [Rhizophagus irregularis DAOM 197198w]|uniref:Uncharacterized protein n=1 Tax=Rhizophagus irregularis (strain DAOM 197198w) TaxID=1432141 RepID=A0A015KG95_RHIIW|nr:hypothetical protein RirG_013300 [Rhizophagus irregularis DAOM 197198w]
MAYEKGNRIQYYPNSSNHQHTKVAVIQEVKPNQIYSILPNGESERIDIHENQIVGLKHENK